MESVAAEMYEITAEDASSPAHLMARSQGWCLGCKPTLVNENQNVMASGIQPDALLYAAVPVRIRSVQKVPRTPTPSPTKSSIRKDRARGKSHRLLRAEPELTGDGPSDGAEDQDSQESDGKRRADQRGSEQTQEMRRECRAFLRDAEQNRMSTTSELGRQLTALKDEVFSLRLQKQAMEMHAQEFERMDTWRMGEIREMHATNLRLQSQLNWLQKKG